MAHLLFAPPDKIALLPFLHYFLEKTFYQDFNYSYKMKNQNTKKQRTPQSEWVASI
jgi:hypothetical protein